MKRLMLFIGLLLLFAAEILRVYFIMPFPGSQVKNTIALAYWINNIIWLRILGIALIILPLIDIFKNRKIWPKVLLSLIIVLYGIIFFFFNFRFEADKMFYPPKEKTQATAAVNKVKTSQLVIGVAINGQAKAYPIQIIGYHHRVMDTVGGTPVMITYCTVCRTGRVFSPLINGKMQSFRLVGMDHFNAMFEDAATGSWWQQATGIAIAGPLKGTALKELPSAQFTLATWLRKYPNSLVMQPDTNFKKDYADLAGYDKGTIKGSLEHTDSASWKRKSWVIGVIHDKASKAYDWNQLVKTTVINDSLGGLPIMLTLENDTASFHVYNRVVNGTSLIFKSTSNNELTDNSTHSTWNMDGLCINGTLKGKQLSTVQAYQEFWHSWRNFHPNTTRYN